MKRSEFYAMFITMIILFTASVSFAVSYQTSVIQPNKPYKYNKEITAADGYNTYNTMVNISGRGILNRCKLQFAGDKPNTKLFIKITVDGAAYEFNGQNAAYTDNAWCFTAADGAYFSNIYGSAVLFTANSLSINGPIYFKTSLKVEVKQTENSSGSQYFMHSSTDYATE